MTENTTNHTLAIDTPHQFGGRIPEAPLAVIHLDQGLTLVKMGKAKLTPELASKILELTPFMEDRALINAHVEYLIKCIKRGTFLPELVNLITCDLNNLIYRINGQHTCWAYLLADMPGWEPAITVSHYHAASEADLRRLYSSVDRGKSRDKALVTRCLLHADNDFAGCSQRMVKMLTSGLQFLLGRDNRLDGEELATLLQTTYKDTAIRVAQWWQGILEQAEHLRRAPVAGAILATYGKLPTKAHEFWDKVADGVGLEGKSDPRYVLRETLTRCTLSFQLGKKNKSLSPENMYMACIFGWNCWREERTCSMTGMGHAAHAPKRVAPK